MKIFAKSLINEKLMIIFFQRTKLKTQILTFVLVPAKLLIKWLVRKVRSFLPTESREQNEIRSYQFCVLQELSTMEFF